MESANINVNHEELSLKKDTSYTVGQEYIEVWKGGMWTVETKLHSVKQTCDECSYNKGTLTIKATDFIKVFKVHGESGC